MIVDNSGITIKALEMVRDLLDELPECRAVIVSAIPMALVQGKNVRLVPVASLGNPWFFIVSDSEVLFMSNGLSWGYRGEGPHGTLRALGMIFNREFGEELMAYNFLVVGNCEGAIKFAISLVPDSLKQLFQIIRV